MDTRPPGVMLFIPNVFSIHPMSILFRLSTFLTLLCSACGRDPASARYGEKVKYREGKAIVFPDFTLTYQGQRRVVPPQYPRGWWAYDFLVKAGGSEQKITWSAGTGLIDWTDFKVGGKAFALELVHSRKAGKLRDGELVVSELSK